MNKGGINLKVLQERRNWGSGGKEREGQYVHRDGEIKGRKRPESNKILLVHEREMMRLRKLAWGVHSRKVQRVKKKGRKYGSDTPW